MADQDGETTAARRPIEGGEARERRHDGQWQAAGGRRNVEEDDDEDEDDGDFDGAGGTYDSDDELPPY
jgi:hypothetical protein